MQHIFNIAIDLDDSRIRESIEKNAEQVITQKISLDVEDALFNHKCYSHSNVSERNRAGVTTWVKDKFEDFLRENKDAIINEAAKMLADRLSRTKAAKGIVEG